MAQYRIILIIVGLLAGFIGESLRHGILALIFYIVFAYCLSALFYSFFSK